GDALWGGTAQEFRQTACAAASRQYSSEGTRNALYLLRCFVHELEPYMVHARGQPRVQVCSRFLRFGAESGVTAADVRHHRMRAPAPISQFDAVLLAGMSAVEVASPFREEAAEHAMLGVEHGQMLVGDHFDAVRAYRGRKRRHLGGVEIVARSQPVQSEVEEYGGGDGIGSVQAEVADQWSVRRLAERVQQAGRTHHDRAFELAQKVDDALFARLEHARAGHTRLDAGGLDALDRGTKAIEIEIVEGNAVRLSDEPRVELLVRSHEKVQIRTAGRRGMPIGQERSDGLSGVVDWNVS